MAESRLRLGLIVLFEHGFVGVVAVNGGVFIFSHGLVQTVLHIMYRS